MPNPSDPTAFPAASRPELDPEAHRSAEHLQAAIDRAQAAEEAGGEVVAFPEASALRQTLHEPVRFNQAEGDPKPWLTLAAIVGNEAHHIERFLAAFEPWVDEIVLVRAIGCAEADATLELARNLVAKPITVADYLNDDSTTLAGWKHVDNFGRARQASWDLARGEFVMWADCDDIIHPDHGKLLREAVDLADFDVLFFPYCVQGHTPMRRERVVRRGCGKWVHAVHEAIALRGQLRHKQRPDIEIWHKPIHDGKGETKQLKSLERNLRILEREAEPQALISFYLHRDHLLAGHSEAALAWGKRAIANPSLTPAEKYKVYYNLSTMFMEMRDFVQCESFAMNGIRMLPDRRECFALMACSLMEQKLWKHALTWIQLCRAISPKEKRAQENWYNEHWYTWRAELTEAFILRKLGCPDQANEIEDWWHGGKPMISLLHATRGRPVQAVEIRDHLFETAFIPGVVEHIFAIDADDKESVEQLEGFRRVVVEPGGGCVRAWNAAASIARGKILVQISDDWIFPFHWDNILTWALKDAVEAGKAKVLGISDGRRTDKLLCMAICTRQYYERQKHEETGEAYLFHPDYKGVFSDDEFTLRAYQVGAVVERRDIVFQHNHPYFQPEEKRKWDATYLAQNSKERYQEGIAVFNRRNPAHRIEPASRGLADECGKAEPAGAGPDHEDVRPPAEG